MYVVQRQTKQKENLKEERKKEKVINFWSLCAYIVCLSHHDV